MKNFDPLTSKSTTPGWLKSLKAQRDMLARLGLHEVLGTSTHRDANGNLLTDAWLTVERARKATDWGPTLCKHGVDLRGDRNGPALCAECAA